jgi:peptidoglycan/LPS O-acetylase OafA/YrhL
MTDTAPGVDIAVSLGTDASIDTGAAAVEAGPTLRFTCFDGLRMFGMLGVVAFHAAFATGADQGRFGQLLSNLQVAVPMFSAISGFLLYRPFILRQLAGKPPANTKKWLRRRFVRVYPVYWFILTFVVLFLGVQLHGLKNAFLYYSLLFPFARTQVALGFGGTAGIAPAWFLTADLCFYLMLPVVTFALIARTRNATPAQKARAALLVCAGLYLFAQVFRLLLVTIHPSWYRTPLIWPTNFLDFFAIGMAMAVISAWISVGGRTPRVVAELSRRAWISWTIALGVYLLLLTFAPPRAPGAIGPEYFFRFFVWGVFVWFMVLPAMFGDQTQGVGRRLLSCRIAVFGGAISYGFYLFHLAVLNKVEVWTDAEPFNGSFPKVYTLTVLITGVLATGAYYVIERPTLQLKDRSIRSALLALLPREAPALPPPTARATGPEPEPEVEPEPEPEPGGAPEHERRARPIVRVLGWCAIASVGLYAVLGAVFVVWGRLNGDEGWYLYAARLVYRGQLPYRDFSFTQMPLLPYVYGPFQLLHQSLYTGRAVSLVFATAAIALCVRVAWREAGRPAAAAVGLLCVAAPTVVYNLTLTKTYALVAFFLAALLATLLSPGRRSITFPLAAAAAVGLALTRTSGVPLAVLVVAYLLWQAPDRRVRLCVGAIAGAGVAILAAFVLPDVAAARFNLASFHQLLWYDAPLRARWDTIVKDRIPDWFGDYWGYVLLVGASVVALVTSESLRRYVRTRAAYALLTAGVVLFLAVQLAAGQFAAVEYVAPVIPIVITIPIVLLSRRLLGPDGTHPVFHGAGIVATVVVVALAALTAVHPSAGEYLVGRDDAQSVASANRVAAYLHDHTSASDEILALWAQPATVAADRDLVPPVTFSLFSYEDLSNARADALHYVNQTRLREIIESRRPAAIVLTDVDRTFLGFAGSLSPRRTDPSPILDAVADGYRKVHSDVGLGVNGPTRVDVYVRDSRP